MDINKFIDPNDVRDYLRKPFNLNDRTIATNGWMLISSPIIKGLEDCPEKLVKNITEILDSVQQSEFKPMPKLAPPASTTRMQNMQRKRKGRKRNMP